MTFSVENHVTFIFGSARASTSLPHVIHVNVKLTSDNMSKRGNYGTVPYRPNLAVGKNKKIMANAMKIARGETLNKPRLNSTNQMAMRTGNQCSYHP